MPLRENAYYSILHIRTCQESSGIPVAVSCTCSRVESSRVPVVLQIMLDCWKRNLADDNVKCCDVCKIDVQLVKMTEELKILVKAINAVGSKGKLK